MAKNAKELGNALANRLKMRGIPNTGESQLGTANAPAPVELSPVEGGITIPASQLGDVMVGDIVTLEVVSNDGTNVSLKKSETTLPPPEPTML